MKPNFPQKWSSYWQKSVLCDRSFAIDSFCTSHSICLSIGFRYGSFLWKWCVFNLSRCSSFLKKFSLSRKSVSKFKNRKRKTKTTLQSNCLRGTLPDDCFYRSKNIRGLSFLTSLVKGVLKIEVTLWHLFAMHKKTFSCFFFLTLFHSKF